MKYIRTKDGRIIKIGEESDIGYESGTFEIHNKAGIVASYEPIEVLKQADTIEELCDEFVIVWKDYKYKHCLWEDLEELRLSYKDWQFDEMENIFGAIWTDKGLIFVAKMNEKGELKLL